MDAQGSFHGGSARGGRGGSARGGRGGSGGRGFGGRGFGGRGRGRGGGRGGAGGRGRGGGGRGGGAHFQQYQQPYAQPPQYNQPPQQGYYPPPAYGGPPAPHQGFAPQYQAPPTAAPFGQYAQPPQHAPPAYHQPQYNANAPYNAPQAYQLPQQPPQYGQYQTPPSSALLPTPPTAAQPQAPAYDRQQAYLPRSTAASTAPTQTTNGQQPPLPPGPPPPDGEGGAKEEDKEAAQPASGPGATHAVAQQPQPQPQPQSQPPLPTGPPPPSPAMTSQSQPQSHPHAHLQPQAQPPYYQQQQQQPTSPTTYGASVYPPPSQQRQQEYQPHYGQNAYAGHQRPHQQHSRPPPPTYCCHKCGQRGHWIQQCPLVQQEQQQRQSGHGHGHGHGHWPQPPSYGAAPPPHQIGAFHHPQQYPPNHSRSYQTPAAPPPGSVFQEYEPHITSYQRYPPPSYQQPPVQAPHVPRPPEPEAESDKPMPFHCEPCEKSFSIESQHVAHLKTHVPCPSPDCEFAASKRVVGAHFQTTHGQYSGNGLKEIDIEGQKFMVLVGDSPEDIEKWRAERRKKWPSSAIMNQKASASASARTAMAAAVTPVGVKRKRDEISVVEKDQEVEEGEIEEGELSEEPGTTGDDKSDGDKIESAVQTMTEKTAPPETEDNGPEEDEFVELPTGVAPDVASPTKKAKPTLLCRKFLRNQCAFGDNCKFSHDRKAFACRVMQQKGSCPKGDACLFSHSPEVIKAQIKQQQSAKQGKQLEEKWKIEQGSLLRKLLKNDIQMEQRKMLQMVRYMVQEQFFQN